MKHLRRVTILASVGAKAGFALDLPCARFCGHMNDKTHGSGEGKGGQQFSPTVTDPPAVSEGCFATAWGER